MDVVFFLFHLYYISYDPGFFSQQYYPQCSGCDPEKHIAKHAKYYLASEDDENNKNDDNAKQNKNRKQHPSCRTSRR
jgi:hypothetical protein